MRRFKVTIKTPSNSILKINETKIIYETTKFKARTKAIRQYCQNDFRDIKMLNDLINNGMMEISVENCF